MPPVCTFIACNTPLTIPPIDLDQLASGLRIDLDPASVFEGVHRQERSAWQASTCSTSEPDVTLQRSHHALGEALGMIVLELAR